MEKEKNILGTPMNKLSQRQRYKKRKAIDILNKNILSENENNENNDLMKIGNLISLKNSHQFKKF